MFIHVVANGRVSVPFWDWTTFHCIYTPHPWGFLCGLCVSGKELPCQCRRCRRRRLDPWIGKIPWSSKWQATPVFLLRKFHGKRSLLGCSPWGHKESDMTECLRTRARLHAFILSVALKLFLYHGCCESHCSEYGSRYVFEAVILFPLNVYLEVGFLDHTVALFLISWGTFILFSIMGVPVYIPTSSLQVFPFLYILATIYLLSFW